MIQDPEFLNKDSFELPTKCCWYEDLNNRFVGIPLSTFGWSHKISSKLELELQWTKGALTSRSSSNLIILSVESFQMALANQNPQTTILICAENFILFFIIIPYKKTN